MRESYFFYYFILKTVAKQNTGKKKGKTKI